MMSFERGQESAPSFDGTQLKESGFVKSCPWHMPLAQPMSHVAVRSVARRHDGST